MGASSTAAIQRGGRQAEHLLGLTADGLGAHIVVDCTGIPEVWADALNRSTWWAREFVRWLRAVRKFLSIHIASTIVR